MSSKMMFSLPFRLDRSQDEPLRSFSHVISRRATLREPLDAAMGANQGLTAACQPCRHLRTASLDAQKAIRSPAATTTPWRGLEVIAIRFI